MKATGSRVSGGSFRRAGQTAIFFRSWYRRVLDDRVLGRTAEESIARVFDEINEFEVQQRDYGTLLVKLYFDVSADVQERRLAQRRPIHGGRGAEDEMIRADDPPTSRRSTNSAPIPIRAGRRGGRSTATTSSKRR